MSELPCLASKGYVLLDTSTNDMLPLNQEFFRTFGMEHFHDSFAPESGEALRLFGLREDELMPDLHTTRDGVLRITVPVAFSEARFQVKKSALFLAPWKISGMINILPEAKAHPSCFHPPNSFW